MMDKKNIKLFLHSNLTGDSLIQRDLTRGLKKHGIEYELFKFTPNLCHESPQEVLGMFGYTTKYNVKTSKWHQTKRAMLDLHNNPKTTLLLEQGFAKRTSYKQFHTQANREAIYSDDIYYSFGWEDICGLGNYKNANSPKDRWEKLGIDLKNSDWKSKEPVLVCGQIRTDTTVDLEPTENCLEENAVGAKFTPQLMRYSYGWQYVEWVVDVCKKIIDSGRPCWFKPHPSEIVKYLNDPECLKSFWLRVLPKEVKIISSHEKSIMDMKYNTINKLEDLLDQVYCTISYSSNCGVESIIAGVPSLCDSKYSMIHSLVGGNLQEKLNDLENIKLPTEQERLQWAYNLAYAQWNPVEIASGEALEHIWN